MKTPQQQLCLNLNEAMTILPVKLFYLVFSLLQTIQAFFIAIIGPCRSPNSTDKHTGELDFVYNYLSLVLGIKAFLGDI